MVDLLHDTVLVGTEIAAAADHVVAAEELLVVEMVDGKEFLRWDALLHGAVLPHDLGLRSGAKRLDDHLIPRLNLDYVFRLGRRAIPTSLHLSLFLSHRLKSRKDMSN